jgi:hypothetical protein
MSMPHLSVQLHATNHELILIRFTQQNACLIGKYVMKHVQKPVLNSDLS